MKERISEWRASALLCRWQRRGSWPTLRCYSTWVTPRVVSQAQRNPCHLPICFSGAAFLAPWFAKGRGKGRGHSRQCNPESCIDQEVYGNRIRFNFTAFPLWSKAKEIVDEKLLGEMRIVYSLTVVVVMQLYIFIKTKELYALQR